MPWPAPFIVLATAGLVAAGAGQVLAQPPPGPPVSTLPEQGPIDGRRAEWAVALLGGIRALAPVAEAELRTPAGLLVALGAGARTYGAFQVGARLAYRIPLSAAVSLRPGLRYDHLWELRANCESPCGGSFYFLDLGIHFEAASGFLFEIGIPIVAWVDVKNPGESGHHKKAYGPPVSMILSSLQLGYRF